MHEIHLWTVKIKECVLGKLAHTTNARNPEGVVERQKGKGSGQWWSGVACEPALITVCKRTDVSVCSYPGCSDMHDSMRLLYISGVLPHIFVLLPKGTSSCP
jgi:hypothetical protein